MNREQHLAIIAIGGLANQMENVEGLGCSEVMPSEPYSVGDGHGVWTEQSLPYLNVLSSSSGVDAVVVWSPLAGWVMGPDLEDLSVRLSGADIFDLAAEVAGIVAAI